MDPTATLDSITVTSISKVRFLFFMIALLAGVFSAIVFGIEEAWWFVALVLVCEAIIFKHIVYDLWYRKRQSTR